MIKLILRVSVLSIAICSCAVRAQVRQMNIDAIGIPLGAHTESLVPVADFSAARCAMVPTDAQATSTISSYYVLDTDVAGKLGIHFVGTVTGEGEAKDVVLVREFRKYASCDATDGSGVIHYGHALRGTVLVTATDLSAGVNFAIVAASATLKNRSAQVRIENTGFANPHVNESAQEAMAAVATTGLTVVTFSKFSEKLEAAYSAAQSSSLSAPLEKVAFVPKTDTIATLRSIAITFGLQCLSEGRPCAEAMTRFPARGQESDAAIRDIYSLVTNSCGAVSEIQRLEAQGMLGRVRVQPRCH